MHIFTDYAPAERDSQETIQEINYRINSIPHVRQLLDIIPHPIIILNRYRQAVHANKNFLNILHVDHIDHILGKRPGEILDCKYSGIRTCGCGCSKFCVNCGAVNSILNCQQNRIETIEECVIAQKSGDSLNLQAWSAPFDILDQNFTLFSVIDTGSAKRKRVLEKIFFHDILNMAGNLFGLARIEMEESRDNDFTRFVYQISQNLLDEIRAQKTFAEAERHELSVMPEPLLPSEIIEDVEGLFSNNYLWNNIKLDIVKPVERIIIHTDRTLLRRVLINLLKNAFEAEDEHKKVILEYEYSGDRIAFRIKNTQPIPEEVQQNIFIRSFSTRGKDRGLGTYSAKILTERYLGGKISFLSNPSQGTVFEVNLPIKPLFPRIEETGN